MYRYMLSTVYFLYRIIETFIQKTPQTVDKVGAGVKLQHQLFCINEIFLLRLLKNVAYRMFSALFEQHNTNPQANYYIDYAILNIIAA